MPVYCDIEYVQEFQIARERIKELEIENAKLAAERDTLRDVINHGGLNKTEPTIDPTLTARSRPTKESHPNIQFWTQADFNNWLLTPEAQITKHGKEPHLEEENSEAISDSHLKSIRESICSAWCELVLKGHAPRVWGELDATNKDFFHSCVETSWPLFKCAENRWKLDRPACTSYPAWHSNHLDENGMFRSKGERRKRGDKPKVEDDSENIPPPSKTIKVSKESYASASVAMAPSSSVVASTVLDSTTLNSNASVATALSFSVVASTVPNSTALDSNASVVMAPSSSVVAFTVPNSTTLDSNASVAIAPSSSVVASTVPDSTALDSNASVVMAPSSSVVTFTVPNSTTLDSNASVATAPSSSVVTSTVPDSTALAPITAFKSQPLAAPPTTPQVTDSARTTQPDSINLNTNKPVPTSPPTSTTISSIAPNPTKVQHQNPFQELSSVASGLGITIPEKSKATTSSNSAGFTGTMTKVSSSSKPVSAVGKKVTKMRPETVRNGRNLCARRWLRAFKEITNGTAAEFKQYYTSLNKGQRDAYDKEAADLVMSNGWNKDLDVSSGTIY